MFESIDWVEVISAVVIIGAIVGFFWLYNRYQNLSERSQNIVHVIGLIFLVGIIATVWIISSRSERENEERYGVTVELCGNLDKIKPKNGSLGSNAKLVFFKDSISLEHYENLLPPERRSSKAEEIEGVICIEDH